MSIFGPKVALLIIDMIDDFVSSDGVMYVPGAEDIIPTIKLMSDEARELKSPVIYICDSHSPSDTEPGTWLRYAENGTPEVQIVPQLAPGPGDFVVTKDRHSSFFGTDLNTLLEELGATKLVLTGAAMDIWMYLTSEDAHKRGYQIAVPRRCVVALSESDKEEVLEQIQRLFGAEVV
jgi:nicotinamidase/pyrazinamidase